MAEFHFLSPSWLWLLPVLLVIVIAGHFRKQKQTSWDKVIAPQLLQHLLLSGTQTHSHLPLILMVLASIVGVIALANPTWEKKPQSVFQTPSARVIVLDLSASMLAADLAPNRLTRAKLKVQDILKRNTEGQTGLVVFAGDAFAVTPLTRDNDTILSQLRVLEPDIVPVQGSRLDLGLLKAADLLKQSAIPAGDILAVADGYNSPRVFEVANQLKASGHRLSILGVGTLEGAPISNGQGDVMRDKNNIPILASLPEERFVQLAKNGDGRYARITIDDKDIDYLLSLPLLNIDKQLPEHFMDQNQWEEMGPYLTLLVLPLAMLAFRRGWLFSVLALVLVGPQPAPVMAFTWDDLWQTPEQQASKALQEKRHEDAVRLSENPAVKGSALYRQNQFQQALEQFSQSNDSDAHYNRGNALARLEQYEEAIKAYDEALKLQPDMQHAIENKQAIEELLKQQQQEQQPGQNTDQQQDEQQESSENQQQEQEQDQQQQQSEQQSQDSQSAEQQSDSQSGQEQDAQPANQQNQAEQQQAQQDQQQQEQAQSADEAQEAQEDREQQEKAELDQEQMEAQPLSSEEEQAAQQWLRRIPDDPGDLLKRKFLYQYQQRQRQPDTMQPW